MKMTTHFLSELDREVERSRRALEQVPEGKYQWQVDDLRLLVRYDFDDALLVSNGNSAR